MRNLKFEFKIVSKLVECNFSPSKLLEYLILINTKMLSRILEFLTNATLCHTATTKIKVILSIEVCHLSERKITLILSTGGPLIVPFWGPRKTVLMEISTIRGVFMV